MPIHNGTEWKSEKAWWVKVGGEWKKSTTIWKKVSGVWEKMTLSVAGLVSTFAGSGTAGDADGVGVLAELNGPTGVCSDANNIYFSDYGNTIRQLDISTSSVTTIAGSGTSGDADGIGVLAEFNNPSGMFFLNAYIYVCDSTNQTLRRIDTSTNEVTTIAGSGVSGDADGVGVLAEFKGLQGVCGEGSNLYICDTNNHKIRHLDLLTLNVTTIAGSGTSGDADGIGVLAEFNQPYGICLYSGVLYISDTFNDKIKSLDISTSSVTTIAGSGTSGDADGIGVLAEFNKPVGSTVRDGLVYIADAANSVIRQLDISTSSVTTIAGSGVYGDADGVGVLAEFKGPWGVNIKDGYLYVSDSDDNKIRRMYIGS